MNFDIFLVGVGGQGVLTIAEIITDAAFLENIPVNYFPTEGMAQRGGFVKAQVRLGRNLAGPNLPDKGSDLIISMEISESLKAVRYIKPGGNFVIWGHTWYPTAVMLGKASYPSFEQVKEQINIAKSRLIFLDPANRPLFKGVPVPENIFTLGASYQNSPLNQIIKVETLKKAISTKWPKESERNLASFEAGLESKIGIYA